MQQHMAAAASQPLLSSSTGQNITNQSYSLHS
jgi:hypothetical protein